MEPQTKCKSCASPIRWVVMESGKRMPLDARSEKRVVRGEGVTYRVVDAYTSHFATCPYADRHRRPAT